MRRRPWSGVRWSKCPPTTVASGQATPGPGQGTPGDGQRASLTKAGRTTEWKQFRQTTKQTTSQHKLKQVGILVSGEL